MKNKPVDIRINISTTQLRAAIFAALCYVVTCKTLRGLK